ncbi:leucine-rich repeat-containing protein 43-like [Anneissia japonica]|uniref:leucine-rich repeat-containing protein 43-like n=1 Tax=Anneissia japonica TaxID=1529436 RepID=UPI0014257BB2|nr:leucine-rich repeat-containing protein 43-like [Anneissia japonica]
MSESQINHRMIRTDTGQNAYEAFENQLRTLCLNEFPCGLGTWRTDQDSVPNTQSVVTLKDYGIQKEQGEVLEELITSKFSPYSVDYSWSDEAQKLRETAVQTPWVVTEQFIQNHFKTLRIVDKQVNEVDERLLQFPNLKELTLSANNLESLNTRHIPRSLEVLELVANNISDLRPLCDDPPLNLQHLGLGHNKIAFLSDCLTEFYWPNLLSLDLSHNNLSGLVDIVQQLLSLNKLRNLSLIANPLALIPGYRGFVVDSFRQLLILDDVRISADEKHHFKGLARRKDLILDETKLSIQINKLSGVPMPQEMLVTEELPEFPIIERKYYMEFTFLEDKKTMEARTEQPEGEKQSEENKGVNEEGEITDITTADAAVGEVPVNETAAITMNTDGTFFTEADESCGKTASDANEALTCNDSMLPVKLIQYCTDKLAWNEDGLDFNFSLDLSFDDLRALKESLRQGLQVALKEDKVLCTPVEESTSDGRASTSSKKGKDSKEKNRKESAKQKDKGKKKKKEPEIELARSEPEVRVLARYHIALLDFVEGEHNYSNECIFEVEEQKKAEKEEQDEVEGSKEKKKRKDSAKGKRGKDGKVSDKDKDSKNTKKTPVKPDKKEGKKRPSSGKSNQSEEVEEEAPPTPIMANIKVMLHEWKTAQDSVS